MTILVATDFSRESRAAADVAAAFAAESHQPLVVMHAVDGATSPHHRELLTLEHLRLSKRGCAVDAVIEHGVNAVFAIADCARRLAAQLVVIGAHDDARLKLLGTTGTSLVHRCPSPLLVVRRPDRLLGVAHGRRCHALVAVSLDKTDAAVRAAVSFLARFAPLNVDVAHFPPRRAATRDRRDAVRIGEREAREAIGAPDHLQSGISRVPRVGIHAIVRDPAAPLDDALAKLASERAVDVIVIGSHRRRGLEDGSIAADVVRGAPVSVLVAGQTGAATDAEREREQRSTAIEVASRSERPRERALSLR